jgi:hypothetical protein
MKQNGPVKICKHRFWLKVAGVLLAGAPASSGAQSLSVPAWGTVQAGQDAAIAEANGRVDLPGGWDIATPPKGGVATISIYGTSDVVVAGVMPFSDARKVVTVLAAQIPPGFTLERIIPVQTVKEDMLQSGAMLKTPDGKSAAKYVFAQPLPNGTTALTALFTANPQDRQALATKMQNIMNVMAQLKAGRTLGGKAAALMPPQKQPTVKSSALPQPAISGSSALPANIEYIGFHGYSTDIGPAILFKGGIICDCMGYAFGATNLAPFKAKFPGDFGKWRKRPDGKYEYLFDQSSDTVWSELGGGPAKPLPANWRTQGTYNYVSSTGFADNMTSSTSSFTFGTDGRFHTGSTISSTASSGGASVFAGGDGGKSSGRYQISGWILLLTYDDGRIVRKTITWQKDPDVIWINGTGYVRG